MKIVVMKFGGTSVANIEKIQNGRQLEEHIGLDKQNKSKLLDLLFKIQLKRIFMIIIEMKILIILKGFKQRLVQSL